MTEAGQGWYYRCAWCDETYGPWYEEAAMEAAYWRHVGSDRHRRKFLEGKCG